MSFGTSAECDYAPSPIVPTLPSGGGFYELPADKDESPAQELFERWHEETAFMSSPDEMKRVDSFRAIIRLGRSVLPSLMSEIGREPSFLFLAAQEITGEDPITDEIRGDVRAMAGAWIGWHQKSKRGLL